MLSRRTSPYYHTFCVMTSIIVMSVAFLESRPRMICLVALISALYHAWRTASHIGNTCAYSSSLFCIDLIGSVAVSTTLFWNCRPMRPLLALCAVCSLASWIARDWWTSQALHGTAHCLLAVFALFYTQQRRSRR